MGLSSRQHADARHSHGADREDDPLKTLDRRPGHPARGRGGSYPHWLKATLFLLLTALAVLTPGTAQAESLRIATWNSDLSRKGPGLLLRDILSRKDPQAEAALRLITGIRADVILLTGFDYDHQLIAAQAFADRLAEEGLVYPHLFALRPNRGMATGLDLDRDNRRGGPGDAQGWGWFSGQNGMLLLSQLPIRRDAVQDYSAFLWADLPGADLPPDMTRAEKELQRLSASGHWQVPLLLPSGETLTLLAWHATPPVFDGPEDRNGRRNHDEAAFWLALLAGTLPFPAPEGDFILLGTSNLDPQDGEGRPAAMRRLLQHALLQDPQPRAGWFTADPAHRGDPALDTAVFAQTGGLRLSVILPSAGVKVAASAVLRADPESRTGADLTLASPHFPLWADLTLAPPPAP